MLEPSISQEEVARALGRLVLLNRVEVKEQQYGLTTHGAQAWNCRAHVLALLHNNAACDTNGAQAWN